MVTKIKIELKFWVDLNPHKYSFSFLEKLEPRYEERGDSKWSS